MYKWTITFTVKFKIAHLQLKLPYLCTAPIYLTGLAFAESSIARASFYEFRHLYIDIAIDIDSFIYSYGYRYIN